LAGKRSFWHGLGLVVALVWSARFVSPAPASWGDVLASLNLPQLRQQAEQFEAAGQWASAGEVWEAMLARARNLPDARDHFQYCQRRTAQTRRHQDISFRKQVTTLAFADTLSAYIDVLNKLHTCYVDRDRADFLPLFKQGLEELRFALNDEAFCRFYLNDLSPDRIASFRQRLQTDWGQTVLRRAQDAENEAREAALAAQQNLGLPPTLVILEFICGACGGLDEYTSYLTPGQFQELTASWKGQAVGIGIEVRTDPLKRLYVAQVAAGSPALRQGIKVGDRVLSIGKRAASELNVETAAALLKGEPGSVVELAVGDLDTLMQPRVVRVTRQLVHMPSVSEPRFLDEHLGIGYLQLLAFQETTLQELDAAIVRLEATGMKALILDLRGNPGGLFDVAVQVAERFLSVGVIVTTHGQEAKYNRSYSSHGADVLDVPLVVLVDGETASSAEMLAGALKDNQRGTLIGQTTFGKGSIQKVRKLERLSAGIRLTVAKFYSPRNLPYSGAGITPNQEVPLGFEPDRALETALDVARPLALGP
jgi:carboxyl-terminal processing protease